MLNINDGVYDSETDHFNNYYIPNDIMVPFSRSDLIITIFSLNFLKMRSPITIINTHNMPADIFMDNIDDLEQSLTYTCDNNKPSKYFYLCSNLDVK